MKFDQTAIAIVSLILVIYAACAGLNLFPNFVVFIFGLSPLLVVWMVVAVLGRKDHPYEELEEGQEFGYVDRPDLGKNMTNINS